MPDYRLGLTLRVASVLLMIVGARAWGAPDNPLAPRNDAFAGSYAGDGLSATFVASGSGNYTGEVKLGDKTFPLHAQQADGKMQGKFSSGADDFEFTATLNGQTLSFNTSGTRYTLEKKGQPVNPLVTHPPLNDAGGATAVTPPPANPANAPSDAAAMPDLPLPKGFSELGTTPSGRAIFSNFADMKSIDDLIQHVGDALGTMFGAKPQFASACVDAKNKNGGVANFVATIKGTPIKGIVIFGLNLKGASSATVIYLRPNTPSEEFTALMQTIPAQPKMHTEQMPDGSGSIDIPEGWTCKTQSLTAGPILVVGPKEQSMLIGGRFFMDTPDGFKVQTAKRSHDSAVNLFRVSGGRGVPPRPLESYLAHLNISPCVGPEEAFTSIIPRMGEQMRQAGKPWAEYGEITTKLKIPLMIPTNEAEVIGTTMKWHTGDKIGPTKQVMMKIETSKADATGAWVVSVDQYVVDGATAARDFPLMLEIYASINIPQAAVQRKLDKDDKAFQSVCAYFRAKNDALLERGREFQEHQKEHFERFEQQQAAQAKARHDACSDVIESSLGVRDVLDTATGQMHKVDLYNSTAITDTLNTMANDPNRFVQIPLRYER